MSYHMMVSNIVPIRNTRNLMIISYHIMYNNKMIKYQYYYIMSSVLNYNVPSRCCVRRRQVRIWHGNTVNALSGPRRIPGRRTLCAHAPLLYTVVERKRSWIFFSKLLVRPPLYAPAVCPSSDRRWSV